MASKSNCENCNAAPAAWFCTADGAYLCARCDIAIHSANKLAMRHERIPIEIKLAKDGLKCRPCTPAFDNAIMGMSQRTEGAEQVIGNDAPCTSDMNKQGSGSGEGDGAGGGGDGDMDWLVFGGGADDPLTSLLNMEQENEANGGGGFSLNDEDLFSMPAASPSGMFAGGSGGSQQLRPTIMSELKSATGEGGSHEEVGEIGDGGGGRLSMDLGTIGENQIKQESAVSGNSDTTQAHVGSGGSLAGSQQQQQQQQQPMGVLGGGPQGEVEAVLTRPFAASALRHAQLQRYRAKRLARHLGHKKIRYECRKTLADNRPRIKGRFAKVHVGDAAGDGSAGGAGSNALTSAQSCPDLTALARLDRELDGSEDSSNKKSRLGNASTTVNSSAAGASASGSGNGGGGGGGGAAAKKVAARGNGRNGGNALKGVAGEQMADNALMGEMGNWGGEGGGGGGGGAEGGLGHLRGGAGRVGMPYTQSEVSLVALDRVVW